MASIIIAGIEEDKSFEKAEALAYHLSSNLPDYAIEINVIPAAEWTEYRKNVYEENRWSERRARNRQIKSIDSLSQIIWRESGELIGNTDDFVALMKHAYGENVVNTGLYRVNDGYRTAKK